MYIVLRAIPLSEECAEIIYCLFLRHCLLQPAFTRKETAGRLRTLLPEREWLAVAFGTVLLILFLQMRFQMTSDYYEASVESAADLFHKWLAVHSPVRYCMTEAALGFMRGMIWAGASMFVSLYVRDRFVITMFPFLGNYVLIRVCQIISLDADWRLDHILIGRTVIRNSGYTVVAAAIASSILVFLMGVCFTKKLVKGLRNGMFYESK